MGKRPLGYRVAQFAGWGILLSLFGVLAWAAFVGPPDCLQFSERLIGQRVFEAPPCMQINDRNLFEARLETNLGPIELVLDPAISPPTVNTFVFLARTGWYDGTVFHRIEKTEDHAFAQAGAANPDGTGHAGFLQPALPPSPILQYRTGLAAMVTSGDPAQISSQFFIIGEDWEAIGATQKGLPQYPPLGRIYDFDSLKVLQSIIAVGTEDGKPLLEVVIERVTIQEIVDDSAPEPQESAS